MAISLGVFGWLSAITIVAIIFTMMGVTLCRSKCNRAAPERPAHAPGMKPTAKVMADYSAFPVWLDAPAPIGSAMAGALPISDALTDALRAWNAEYDTNRLDAERWSALEDDWNARGIALARRLADELGGEWDVVYFNELTGETAAVS